MPTWLRATAGQGGGSDENRLRRITPPAQKRSLYVMEAVSRPASVQYKLFLGARVETLLFPPHF